MHLRRLQLTNFRNLRGATASFSPGITIVLGDNGAGKTSLLEAAQFVCSGRSFRTSREAEMVRAGATYFRLEAEIENGSGSLVRAAAYEPGAGLKIDSGGGPRWIPAGSVLCFSPDDLQLIKGPPAGRRRFLDETIGRRHPVYLRDLADYQKVLAQRNSFLQRARAGLVRLADISPWDRQLAALAVRIHRERADHCLQLSPCFEAACREITGTSATAGVDYVSQLGGLDPDGSLEQSLTSALEEGWSEDLERVSTGTGVHRDDVVFNLAGSSLRIFGSQGEQRAAVLALLLADRKLGGEAGREPLLLLDDVMSELDPDRRRRLMAALSAGGDGGTSAAGTPGAPVSQTIITAADAGLFTREELEGAGVIEVSGGSLQTAGAAVDE